MTTILKKTSNLDFNQLTKIYLFLEKNKEHNEQFQVKNLKRLLQSVDCIEERARLLLHDGFNTQSKPNIDLYFKFIKCFFGSKNKSALSSLTCLKEHLCKQVNIGGKCSLKMSTFELLNKQPGWGDKTSALFVKNLYLISTHQILKNYFWDDVDEIKDSDIEILKLPVDAVIKRIFNSDINTINKKIEEFNCKKNLQKHQIVIWDDLWFWGFITQNSKTTGKRALAWNESKFMSQFEAHGMDIKTIRRLAQKFIGLLN